MKVLMFDYDLMIKKQIVTMLQVNYAYIGNKFAYVNVSSCVDFG